VIAGLVEPGERMLWAGHPDREAMLGRQARRFWLRMALTPVLLAGMAWLAVRALPVGAFESVPLEIFLESRVLVPLVIVLVGIPVLSGVLRKRFERYVGSLTYAMTDRRLLVVEGDEVVDQYRPEQLGRVHVRRRSRGFDDVNFGRRSSTRAGTRVSRDAVQREREYVGFKALADADAMQAAIEKWVASHQSRAESASAGFLEAVTDSADRPEIERSDVDRTDHAAGGACRITHNALGLRIEFPESWRIRVRNKKKPRGRVFFDSERWREPEEAGPWNVVLGEGPMRCSVEVEVFETSPTVSYEALSKGRVATAVAGTVIDSDAAVEINSLNGFCVTRRKEIQVTESAVATLAEVVALQRETVLHDGRRQVWIRSTWPEESKVLGQVVDRIVRSTRLTDSSVISSPLR
jgi:hypothetical protein